MERDNRAHSWLGDTLRAHALQFKAPLAPTHGQAVGNRILVSFLVVGIGLIFGIVYARSGNLWIPAVMHGIWPPNMS